MVSSSNSSHFILTNGNWSPTDKASLREHSEKVDFIATVKRENQKCLMLIEEIKQESKHGKSWLTTSKYPEGFLAESLDDPNLKHGCRIRIRPDNRDSEVQVSWNSDVLIKNNNGKILFRSDEERLNELRVSDNSRAQFYFTFRVESDESGMSTDYYIWSNFRQKNRPLLENAAALFNSHIRTLVTHQLKTAWPSVALTSHEEQTWLKNHARKEDVVERQEAHVLESKEVNSEQTEPSLDSKGAEDDEVSVEAVAQNDKTTLSSQMAPSETAKATLSLEKFRKKITNRPKFLTHYGPFAVFVITLIFYLADVRQDSERALRGTVDAAKTSADVVRDQITFSVTTQYVLFAFVVVGTISSLLLSRPLNSLLKKFEVSNFRRGTQHRGEIGTGNSENMKLVNRLRTVLEVVILTFLVYLIAAAIAWPDVTDDSHIWIWSDRQTIGLVITMLIGVISALFSNALRDLSNKKVAIRDEAQLKIDRSRYLLNQIHELADRLWSEYEQMYKNKGKLFVFRANEFAKMGQGASNSFDSIVKNLENYLRRVEGSEVDDSSASKIVKQLEEEFKDESFDWADGGVQHGYPDSQIIPWEEHFQLSDVTVGGSTKTSDLTCSHLLEQIPTLFGQFENGVPAGSRVAGPTSEISKFDYERVLFLIAQIFLSESDGRFTVAPVSEIQKRILETVRKIYALVAKLPAPRVRENGAEEPQCVWGYFPSDETLTLWFIDAIRRSASWAGFETWLEDIYAETQEFANRNKHRRDELTKLTRSFEELVSSEGIPSGLLLDDVHLLQELLSTGSDALDESTKIHQDDKDLTISRILTYAGVYYEVLVWGRGPDRALLPTFPSPLPGMEADAEIVRTRHATERFEALRRNMMRTLGDELHDDVIDLDEKRQIMLEVSNRQGPLSNWMRAARAYSRRQDFLFSKISIPQPSGWLEDSEPSREILLVALFPGSVDENGKAVNQELALALPVTYLYGTMALNGPRSLKVRRKSSISESSKSWEGHDD